MLVLLILSTTERATSDMDSRAVIVYSMEERARRSSNEGSVKGATQVKWPSGCINDDSTSFEGHGTNKREAQSSVNIFSSGLEESKLRMLKYCSCILAPSSALGILPGPSLN